MNNWKILVVEDEPRARRVLRAALAASGFEVSEAATGEESLEKLSQEPPDVILLDLKMPGMGGLQACGEIRGSSEVPIIGVSGMNTGRVRTQAFEAGADQFVSKPCGIEELVARIRGARRRADMRTAPVLVLGDVEINMQTREVKRKDGDCYLTAKEFKLLYCLAYHPGAVMTYRHLLEVVWGPGYGDQVEYLRVRVNQLRKKIEPDPARPEYLLTDFMVGYRLRVPPQGQDVAGPQNGTNGWNPPRSGAAPSGA